MVLTHTAAVSCVEECYGKNRYKEKIGGDIQELFLHES